MMQQTPTEIRQLSLNNRGEPTTEAMIDLIHRLGALKSRDWVRQGFVVAALHGQDWTRWRCKTTVGALMFYRVAADGAVIDDKVILCLNANEEERTRWNRELGLPDGRTVLILERFEL